MGFSDDFGAAGSRGNVPEYTVSEISRQVKREIENRFGRVRVRGEVGRVTRSAAGHVYLDLKERNEVLSAVIWRGAAGRLTHFPEEGMEIVATGKLTAFSGQSRYQLSIETVEPAGIGALMAMLEKRRQKLRSEGLFEQEYKQALPFLPEVVGIITSPTGSVIRDILHRFRDRFPRSVLLWPVAVQGENCPGEVVSAVRGFNALKPGGQIPRPDILIIARGGGSVEDLWGFNDENVARAVFSSSIPVISAIGHETDTTLVDYVADHRAPTPSAAAERAVPVQSELLERMASLDDRRIGALARLTGDLRKSLSGLYRALPNPSEYVNMQGQHLDLVCSRLERSFGQGFQERQGRFAAAVSRMRGATILRRIEQLQTLLSRNVQGLIRATSSTLERKGTRQDSLARLMQSLGYGATLQRGFALVRRGDDKGAVITDLAGARGAWTFDIQFRDGHLSVRRPDEDAAREIASED